MKNQVAEITIIDAVMETFKLALEIWVFHVSDIVYDETNVGVPIINIVYHHHFDCFFDTKKRSTQRGNFL